MSYVTYAIENTVTGGVYIGKAVHPPIKRWNEHRSALCAGTHHNRFLQRSWNKYGEDVFVFRVMKTHETEAEAFAAERTAIAFYREETRLPVYNSTDGGDGVLGWERTADHIARLSVASQRRWQDEAQRAKAAEQTRKRFASPEERAAQSERIKATVARMQSDPSLQEQLAEARRKKSESQQRRWADPVKRAIAAEKQRAARARQREQRNGS